jgi:hypothetical protein
MALEVAYAWPRVGRLALAAPGEYRDVDLVGSDPRDNPVVAAALEMQAQYVVTLDAGDLLRLKVFLVPACPYCSMIFWQVAVNIGMVTGVLPVVGVTLPLIGCGGSSARQRFGASSTTLVAARTASTKAAPRPGDRSSHQRAASKISASTSGLKWSHLPGTEAMLEPGEDFLRGVREEGLSASGATGKPAVPRSAPADVQGPAAPSGRADPRLD